MMTKIYDLAYEINGDTINLEQDMGCGEVSRIDLHPIHLRLLAEEVGLLAPSSDIEADRTIARLCRQMRILADRIDRLDTMFLNVGANGHECVDVECAFSAASSELANEFVNELPLDADGECFHPPPTVKPSPDPTTISGQQSAQNGCARGQMTLEASP